VWSSKAAERGSAAVLAPVMEMLGRDWSLLGLVVRVVELDEVGELESEELYIVHILFLQKVYIEKCNIRQTHARKVNFILALILLINTLQISCLTPHHRPANGFLLP
jgi:hypothetical protein